jgi:SAM-dependent methyltransferase
MDRSVASVARYWDGHTLGKQYVRDASIEVGSPQFFDHIRPWMNPYKFPEIMPRIDREAGRLRGLKLLEVGCGMGFDSVEFLKRGVRVTATDLTPTAVALARRHFEVEHVVPDDVRVENLLQLSFADESFDAVWACGVVHHTGDCRRALKEIWRVLRPGGTAIISHFYRRPSWMFYLSRLGRENIEFKEEDPPVTDFLTEPEVLALFEGFDIEEAVQDHYRALPIARRGWKAALYTHGFRPVYNRLPEPLAKKLAYKYSVIARKKTPAGASRGEVAGRRLNA